MSIFSLCLPPSPPPPPGTRFCQQIVWIPSALAALTGGGGVGGGEAARNLIVPTVLSSGLCQVLRSPPRSEGPPATSSGGWRGRLGVPAQTSALLCPFHTVLSWPTPPSTQLLQSQPGPGRSQVPAPAPGLPAAGCPGRLPNLQPRQLPRHDLLGGEHGPQAGVLLISNWLAASVRACSDMNSCPTL